jgi:hypothetical protein
LARLETYGLLPTEKRQHLVATVAELAVTTPDADFLTIDRVRRVFTTQELQLFVSAIRKDVIPTLRDIVWDWRSNYDRSQPPEDYFDLLSDALRAYLKEFADDAAVVTAIKENQERISDYIAELEEDYPRREHPAWDQQVSSPDLSLVADRSIFDDVDV